MNPQLLSLDNEHYTPIEYIEAARKVMGSIDLDPATSHSVNASRVKARNYYVKADNGLSKCWRGNVWLNPPGGVLDGKSHAAVWWDKLVDEWLDDRTRAAIFLGFSLEILAQSQDARVWIGHTLFCVPRTRIKFEKEVTPGVFVPGDQPTHANIISYLPPKDRTGRSFVKEFSQFGNVCDGARP